MAYTFYNPAISDNALHDRNRLIMQTLLRRGMEFGGVDVEPLGTRLTYAEITKKSTVQNLSDDNRVVGLIHWDTLLRYAVSGRTEKIKLNRGNFDHAVEQKLPEFVGRQYVSRLGDHPFFIVPEIEDTSSHGTRGMANGTYRRVYHSGRSFRIGDEQETWRQINGWMIVE